jgi:hypothetical protein
VIFGREDRFLNLFAKLLRFAPVMPLAGADVRFQPVYVGDVAECMARALPLDATFGKKYPLCGPQIYALRDLVRYVGSLTGASPRSSRWSEARPIQATVLEHLPGSLMSRDNLASMTKDSVCGCEFPAIFGIARNRSRPSLPITSAALRSEATTTLPRPRWPLSRAGAPSRILQPRRRAATLAQMARRSGTPVRSIASAARFATSSSGAPSLTATGWSSARRPKF